MTALAKAPINARPARLISLLGCKFAAFHPERIDRSLPELSRGVISAKTRQFIGAVDKMLSLVVGKDNRNGYVLFGLHVSVQGAWGSGCVQNLLPLFPGDRYYVRLPWEDSGWP